MHDSFVYLASSSSLGFLYNVTRNNTIVILFFILWIKTTVQVVIINFKIWQKTTYFYSVSAFPFFLWVSILLLGLFLSIWTSWNTLHSNMSFSSHTDPNLLFNFTSESLFLNILTIVCPNFQIEFSVIEVCNNNVPVSF